METFSDLVDGFGGAAKMAPQISESPNTIRQWVARGSVPARYWQQIIEAAQRLSVRGVTYAALAELANRKKATPPRRQLRKKAA
jgi:hypothetical protein